MPVASQEYDGCYPFVWCVWAFDFAIWFSNIRFGCFVILLFDRIRVAQSFVFYVVFVVHTIVIKPYLRDYRWKVWRYHCSHLRYLTNIKLYFEWWLTSRNWQWESVVIKNNTLRHRRWFKLPNCEPTHFYVVTSQHLHMEYISPSLYKILELAFQILIFWIEGWCLQGSYWNKSCKGCSINHPFGNFTDAITSRLTVIKYLVHIWRKMCSNCCNHNLVLPYSNVTYWVRLIAD